MCPYNTNIQTGSNVQDAVMENYVEQESLESIVLFSAAFSFPSTNDVFWFLFPSSARKRIHILHEFKVTLLRNWRERESSLEHRWDNEP